MPPIVRAFRELCAEKRFDGAHLEFIREVDPPRHRYQIVVRKHSGSDVAAYATMMAALGDFASKHDLEYPHDRLVGDAHAAWPSLGQSLSLGSLDLQQPDERESSSSSNGATASTRKR